MINAEAERDAKTIISAKGARLWLVAAFVFITASAGVGLIASYLLLNLLDYFKILVSNDSAYAVMFVFVFFFAAPAFSGMRHITAAVCDGREVSPSELFIAFSSFERFCSAYLGTFAVFMRYAVAVLIIYVPDIAADMIFQGSDDLPVYFYAIAFISVLIAICAWLFLTRKISRLFYFLWSRKMSFFKALAATIKHKYIFRRISSSNFLNILLSVATCFILFILHAGPLFAIESELSMRRQENYIENLKNNERTVKSND